MAPGTRHRAAARRLAWAAGFLFTTALGACGSDAGSACAIDTDCAPGLWCDRRVSTCVAPVCAGDECTLPPLDASDPPLADALPHDTGGSPPDGDGASPEDATDPEPPPCAPEDQSGEARTWRVTKVRVGTSGRPPEGLDVDEDASTCAPADQCEAGVDNAFAGLAGAVNLFYDEATKDGSLRLGVVLSDTACGALHLVDVLGEGATLTVAAGSRSGGALKTAVQPAALAGNELEAGPGGTLVIPLLVLGVRVEVPIRIARARGNIGAGDPVVTWAGAVDLGDLEVAVRSIPEETLDLVGGHDGALNLLAALYAPDLDLSGDGVVDAASIGFVTELEPAEITGW